MSVGSGQQPGIVWVLLALLGLQAAGAIAGGVGLVQDPVENIGMPLSLLQGSPFSDYLIPGLILLVAVGLPPLVAAVSIVWRWRWGWWLALVAGAGLLVWIIVEVILLGYLPGSGIGLQIAMGLLGAAILVVTLTRSTRRYLGVGHGQAGTYAGSPDGL